MIEKFGEVAALVTAVSWTAAAMIFERVSKMTGVTSVNTFKVAFGTIYLAVLAVLLGNNVFPFDFPVKSWIYMSISGFVGFVIGDYFLFNAYVMIGSRIAMLLMAASVPMTAIASYFLFGESIGQWGLYGIVLAVSGISLTVVSGKKEAVKDITKARYMKGVIFGLLSAVAMAAGTLFTKVGAENVSPVAATQVRILSALFGFILFVLIFRKTSEIFKTLRDFNALKLIAIGSIFGPFIGVGALLYALQHTKAGVVSTISSLTPVLIIAPSIIFFKKRVSVLEIAGACIAIGGVALLFM
jgi:drug/metabolite transporter (DMT)-like permease